MVGSPRKLAEGINGSTELHRPESLPSSYSAQTLRTQAIEFSPDLGQSVIQAAQYEAHRDASIYDEERRMLAAITMPSIRKRNDEEPNDEVLILHVAGVHQNELGESVLRIQEV